MLLFRRQFILSLLCLLAPALTWAADPLEEALTLVLSVSPLVLVHIEEVQAVERAAPWEFRQHIIHAREHIEIPTAERERVKEITQAKIQLEIARQQVAREFLTEVQGLCERQSKHLLAGEMISFYKDQLDSHKRMEREGLIDATALWEFAKQTQESKNTARQTEVEYQAALDRVARQYGGSQWQKLEALLDAHVKRTKP